LPDIVPGRVQLGRNTQRSGVSPSTSTLCVLPLTLMVKATVFSRLLATPISAAVEHANDFTRSRTVDLAFGGDVDDSLSKSLRGFLRQIMPDAAGDIAVRILAGEFRRVGAGVRMRRAVGVTFQRNRRCGDNRAGGKALFQIVEFGLAFGEAQAPSIIVDHDVD